MYDELKKLAENATQGPWVAAGPSPQYCEEVLVYRAGDEDDTCTVCQAPTGLEKESTADMEFIAAANPSAVLALIAEVERLKREEKNDAIAYKAEIERQEELRAEFKEWQASHHANYCKAADERDQLKAENEVLRKDAERLNWLDKRSMPVAEGQCMSQPEGELWGYSWTVAGQCSTVRDAIDHAMDMESGK